jgi:Ser/Thr protein kinase RdoA (MazF antagonist)
LTVIKTKDNKNYYLDEDGNYWRLYIYVDQTHAYDIVDSEDKAYEGGYAFGRFATQVADLPAEKLHETIVDFHNIVSRLQQFSAVVAADPVGRVAEVEDKIQFVKNRSETMQMIVKLAGDNQISQRVTHNDTKFNNVLFDVNEKPVCVVDLDTVMPGYIHFDYGDAIRTAANSAAEDEQDLTIVEIDIKLFRAFTIGFLEQTHPILNEVEVETLVYAARLLTFIMGLRFLTDYIDGDNYYKINHPQHNLHRAGAQFKLLTSMESRREEMEKIVLDISTDMVS